MIWPAPGVTAERLADVLSSTYNISNPVMVGVTGAVQQIDRYLAWVNEAARMLGPVLRKTDLDRLLLTPRYWATLANPTPTTSTLAAVQQEAHDRSEDIGVALRQAQELRERWVPDRDGTKIIVPDTGLFLHHKIGNKLAPVATIDWRVLASALTYDEVRVVVPILVVDELETIKDKKQKDVSFLARQAVNQLFDWFQARPDQPHDLVERSAQTGRVSIELLPDVHGHSRLPRNDDELVDRALAVKDLQASPVVFLSYDTGAVLRAKLAGLTGQRLRDQPVSRPDVAQSFEDPTGQP